MFGCFLAFIFIRSVFVWILKHIFMVFEFSYGGLLVGLCPAAFRFCLARTTTLSETSVSWGRPRGASAGLGGLEKLYVAILFPGLLFDG